MEWEDIAPYNDEHLGFKEAAEELHVSQREIARLIFIKKLPCTGEIAFPWELADIYANREKIYFQRRDIEEYKEDPEFYKAINPANWFPNMAFSKASESAGADKPEIAGVKPKRIKHTPKGRPRDKEINDRVRILRGKGITSLTDLKNPQKRLNAFADLDGRYTIPGIGGMDWLKLHRDPERKDQLNSVIETLRKNLARYHR